MRFSGNMNSTGNTCVFKGLHCSNTLPSDIIQKFAGAMMGPPKVEKGLFITNAKFSPGAKQFAKAQHIILVDGKKLTELMIENELGVTTQKTYKIRRVDSDYFPDNSL